MKKCICLFISCILLLSLFQFMICAESTEEGDWVRVSLASAPTVSRSTNTFVEGETGELKFTFNFVTDFGVVVEEETISYEYVYITVPYTNESVEAYRILNDFKTETIMYLNVGMTAAYPDADFAGDASHFYNCHSYAWYSDDTDTNCYWIDDPEGFYTSYMEVSTPAVGDIICYFDGDDNTHSGIVKSVDSSSENSVTVVSKWGFYGLYEHDVDDCPYAVLENEVRATIRYYRYHPYHNYTYSQNLSNPSVHIATCSTCGYSTTENHTYRTLPGGGSRCTKCGYTSSGQIIMSDTPKPVEQ